MYMHVLVSRGAFQYQKISLPKMSFGLVQSGWGESECFNKNLAPGSSEVFKDIFRAYRNAPLIILRGADTMVTRGYNYVRAGSVIRQARIQWVATRDSVHTYTLLETSPGIG